MSNTIRDLSELLTLFADNNSNQITAQDIRDLIVTTDSWRFSGDYNDLDNTPNLGTLSSQDANNVNITGGNLSNINVSGSFNTGLDLSPYSFSTSKLSVRSAIVDLKQVAENEIFAVPANHMFLIDSMEIITTSISGVNNSLQARFGNNSNPQEYYEPNQIKNFSVGDRHIIEIAQNAALSGCIITFGIVEASTANYHEGFGLIHGSLIKLI